MSWLGLDIGGANLKAADGDDWTRSRAFPLWREPNRLTAALAALIADAPKHHGLAVTMTGELCDCFASKAEGVRYILAAVGEVAAGRDVCVYLVDGRFATIDEACALPQRAAASNWHALARVAAQIVEANAAILVDIGSTTTDIIPIIGGEVCARGRTDTERLSYGELLYRGVGRTPVCAIVQTLPWGRERCPVAGELFATTADAYVLLGDLAEDQDATWTADGRPLTVRCAQRRLARQICADSADCSAEDFAAMASAIRDAQTAELRLSLEAARRRFDNANPRFILGGWGEFLASRAVGELQIPGMKALSLAELVGIGPSAVGPAWAVAKLANNAEVKK